MSFQDQADLAVHPGFGRRVRTAMVKVALAVGAEADDPQNPERSQKRRMHSASVLQSQEAWAERYAWAVPTNPSITLGSSDGDIEFTVISMFDAMAGAPPVAA